MTGSLFRRFRSRLSAQLPPVITPRLTLQHSTTTHSAVQPCTAKPILLLESIRDHFSGISRRVLLSRTTSDILIETASESSYKSDIKLDAIFQGSERERAREWRGRREGRRGQICARSKPPPESAYLSSTGCFETVATSKGEKRIQESVEDGGFLVRLSSVYARCCSPRCPDLFGKNSLSTADRGNRMSCFGPMKQLGQRFSWATPLSSFLEFLGGCSWLGERFVRALRGNDVGFSSTHGNVLNQHSQK